MRKLPLLAVLLVSAAALCAPALQAQVQAAMSRDAMLAKVPASFQLETNSGPIRITWQVAVHQAFGRLEAFMLRDTGKGLVVVIGMHGQAVRTILKGTIAQDGQARPGSEIDYTEAGEPIIQPADSQGLSPEQLAAVIEGLKRYRDQTQSVAMQLGQALGVNTDAGLEAKLRQAGLIQ